MEPYNLNGYTTYSEASAEPLYSYTAKTFAWMFAGLLVTFLTAIAGYATGAVIYVFAIPYGHFILLLAELGVVIFLSARVNKLSVGAARALFFAYAILNGVTFSAYFLIYDMLSLVMVFGLTAVYFGLMAMIGYFVKVDLSRMRNVLFGGAIFLAVFWVLSMFLNLSGFETIACMIGIVIFLGYTAYDTQKIKAYYEYYSNDAAMASKASVFSALALYLDFINIFIYLLRILGKRRN